MPRHAAACHGAQLRQRAHGADRPAEFRTARNSSERPDLVGAENAGVRKASSRASCMVPGENGKRYQFHQPASNDCSACSPDLSLLSSQSNSGIPALDPMTTVVATLARARMCAYIYFH